MNSVVLIVHLLIAVSLIALVLMQRSEGGALGMGGGSGSLISGRGAADALARMTAILAIGFFVTSISLTLLAGGAHATKSVVDQAPQSSPLDWLFPKKPPAPAPVNAAVAPPPPAPVAPPLSATPAGDVVPGPADALQHAGPLGGPAVAPLPPLSASPPAASVAVTPKLTTPPVTPAAAAKPAASSAPVDAKPPVHPVKPATAKPPESGHAAPPPSRAGPDE